MTALIHTDSDVLVHAPGHLYTPLAVEPKANPPTEQVKPGELEVNEKRFLTDLIRFLAPQQLLPNSIDNPIPLPLEREGVEYVLVRNIDQFPHAFRIRMPGDAHWFYPDFLLWITDRNTAPATQTLCLIDPKGIWQGLRDGWGDSKLLSLLYRLRDIERQCAPTGVVTLPSGETVRFRARGVLISNTPFQDLVNRRQFALAAGRPSPCRATFAQAGIFFMDDDRYIERMHDYLRADDDWLLQRMGELAGREDTTLGRWFSRQLAAGHYESACLDDLLGAVLPASGEPRTEDAASARIERYLSTASSRAA